MAAWDANRSSVKAQISQSVLGAKPTPGDQKSDVLDIFECLGLPKQIYRWENIVGHQKLVVSKMTSDFLTSDLNRGTDVFVFSWTLHFLFYFLEHIILLIIQWYRCKFEFKERKNY